ncbi:MAG: mechanosensitive ion channel family protein [Pseudomonadota bacterium]
MEKVDADTGNIFEKLDAWVDGFFTLLPNITLAIFVLSLFIAAAFGVARLVRSSAEQRGRDSLGDVAGSLLRGAVILVGAMLAITIVVPSISPGDLFAGLGVSSVAIGFAFKDILQNMLAGILILIRQPFEVGDEIVSGGHRGKVEKIETRATLIRTYDGQRVVIPNAEIYTDAVTVITAFEKIRSQYDIGIGCNDDWDKARRLMVEAAGECEGVLSDPAPETIPVALGDFANIVRLRWWTKSDRGSVIHTQGRVLQAVYKRLDENGIDMPYPTSVTLFHDQTEEFDGDRARQREGWPVDPEGETPQPARISQAMQESSAEGEQPRQGRSARAGRRDKDQGGPRGTARAKQPSKRASRNSGKNGVESGRR